MVPIWPDKEVNATLEEDREVEEGKEEVLEDEDYYSALKSRIIRLEKVVKEIVLELQELGADLDF